MWQDSVEDVEEGDTEGNEDLENEDLETEDDYGGFAFTQQDVICSIQDKAGILAVGSCSTVNWLFTCSLIRNYWAIYMMQNAL